MMCDKVIFLAHGGYLAYYGPPEQALPYFDQYRTPQERQTKDIEFDDIYRILSDESRGSLLTGLSDTSARASTRKTSPRDARSRSCHPYLAAALYKRQGRPGRPARRAQHSAPIFHSVITQPANPHTRPGQPCVDAAACARHRIDGLYLGQPVFDVEKGDAGKAITMLFMAALITILVGAAVFGCARLSKKRHLQAANEPSASASPPMSSPRSGSASVIALYQSLVYLFFKLLFVRPPLDASGLGAFYFHARCWGR